MPSDRQFTVKCPAPLETFSYHQRPCLNEDPCTGNGEGSSHECPYRSQHCQSLHERWFDVLASVYTTWFKVTLSEPSATIVGRAEHQYNQYESLRLALRKHIHEVLAAGPASKMGLRCEDIEDTDRFGAYLGFVDFRLHSVESPIALALLTPPRHLRMDPMSVVVTGDYGPIFGGPSFDCTVYSMQDEQSGGAKCAQICVLMLLAALSDRGAKVLGSFTLSYIALEAKSDGNLEIRCLDQPERPESYFELDGLNPTTCKKLLNDDSLKTRATAIQWPDGGHFIGSELLVLRLIEGYILARYPVMLFVDNKEWCIVCNDPIGSEECAEPRAGQSRIENAEPGQSHSVVIIGFRGPMTLADARLIVHDPARRPFLELPAKDCFHAAWAYSREFRKVELARARAEVGITAAELDELAEMDVDRLNLVVGTDRSVLVDAEACLESIETESDPNGGVPAWDNLDFRVRLLHSDDLLDSWLVGYPPELKDDLEPLLPTDRTRFWCISAFAGDRARRIWLFDAENPNGTAQCARRFEFAAGTVRRTDHG